MHGVRVGTSRFTNGQKKEGTKSSSVGEQTARSLFSLFFCLLQNFLSQGQDFPVCPFFVLDHSVCFRNKEKNLQATVPRGDNEFQQNS